MATGLNKLFVGLATGALWICYFRALKLGDAARVAPLDKLSFRRLSAGIGEDCRSPIGWAF